MCWSWKANVEADVQFENWDGIVLRNNAIVISLDSKFEGILASHVLWDWDTTSLPCSRMKTLALNVLMENTFKDELDEKFGKDRGDRRPTHAHQPQILSDAQCSQEITDIKHTLMGSLQKA